MKVKITKLQNDAIIPVYSSASAAGADLYNASGTVVINPSQTVFIGTGIAMEIPEGYIFVMGDNREGSSDSREFGCIPLDKVEGRVTYRIWPLSEFGKIDK